MGKPTTSTADEQAAIEKTAELRAMQAELASREQARLNAEQDAKLAADRVAAELLKLNPVVHATVVPAIPAWQPVETLTGEQVRAKGALFIQSVLDAMDANTPSLNYDLTTTTSGQYDIIVLLDLTSAYEPGELLALATAITKGSAIKAAPRHNADCVEYAEFLAAKGKPANCVAGCPMVGYKPPTVGGTSAAPRASSSTVGSGSGHSAGKVSFVGPDGTTETELDCSVAARKAAAAFPTAERCIAWVANRDANGPQASARLPLMGDIARGNVPQGTFGDTITTAKATPAGAPYPFTPAESAAA
jgi:hypothetical protein